MKKQTLLTGRAGANQTLDEMKRLTVEAIHSQAPRQLALELFRAPCIADPSLFVDAFLNWILIHVDIVDEFEELLISPCRILAEVEAGGRSMGDCDDMAMLSASVLASVGAMARLVACWPNPDGSFQHVFCQYKFPRSDNWRDFDPTRGYNQPDYPTNDLLIVDIIS